MGESLFEPQQFRHVKDPCIVFDGKQYHIYGSGAKGEAQVWGIAHFTAPDIDGPWTEVKPVVLCGVEGPRVCAPGVIFDGIFHMFIQTECFGLNGTIEYATSEDGEVFTRVNTALTSLPGDEAGIYDPHPAMIVNNGVVERYFTYTGMQRVSHGDLYLAKSSGTWAGPWERLGKILRHEEVAHHNQHEYPDYEWGLEGSQLLQLPDGRFLLNAVCFLPEAPRGRKQRVFFAVSEKIFGPYCSLGPIILPSATGWDSAENGHASVLLKEGKLHLFYQAKALHAPWRYGRAVFDPAKLPALLPPSDLLTPQ
jgi:hypothetical protein